MVLHTWKDAASYHDLQRRTASEQGWLRGVGSGAFGLAALPCERSIKSRRWVSGVGQKQSRFLGPGLNVRTAIAANLYGA